jgi:hypothetical protein
LFLMLHWFNHGHKIHPEQTRDKVKSQIKKLGLTSQDFFKK